MARATNPYRHYSVLVSDGGNLVSGSNSQDTAGAANYVEKINFRRETDGEVRREGWNPIESNFTDVSKVGTGNDPIRLLFQFESEGDKVLVCASGDTLYRFRESSNEWEEIAYDLCNIDGLYPNSPATQATVENYNLNARRWEAVAIDGYCIINNGVDLPMIYRGDWPCAFPMFSLRERGIVRCGTIAEFDGRLFIGNVEYFDENITHNFEYFMGASSFPYGLPELFNEYDDYVTTYTVPHMVEFSAWRLADDQNEAKAAPYLFGQTYKGKVSAMNGSQLQQIEIDYPLGGARDVDEFYVSAVHNPYFFIIDPDEVDYTHSTFIKDDSIRMSITDSAGVVKVYDADIELIRADYVNGKTTITLRDAYNNTADGVLTNTGDPQSGSSANISIGNTVEFILLKEPDTFSDDARIVRESADSFSFPDDGTSILRMAKLSDKLMVHRESGYLSISRGDEYTAFYYEERYKGERVADFSHTVVNIDDKQVFMGYNGVYFITLASTEPEPFTPLMIGPESWRLIGFDETEHVYSQVNPLTNEVFFICPINFNANKNTLDIDYGVLAYDMTHSTVSQIDNAFTAMCTTLPTSRFPSRRFIMATHVVRQTLDLGGVSYSSPRYIDSELAKTDESTRGGVIVRYGYGSREGDSAPFREFTRIGEDYESKIVFGKNDFSDRFSEKKLRSYALHMSDIFDYSSYMAGDYVEGAYGYLDTAVVANVKLSTYSTTQITETEEIIEKLEDMSSEVMIPTYAQGNYYQDTISLTGVGQPFKFIGRTFEVSGVRTRHTSEVTSDAA